MKSHREGFIKLFSTLCIYLAFSATHVSAAIISIDWLAPGDNLITRDTSSGLEWLDLTQTANQSFNTVTGQLGVGGTFEGWSYATGSQVATFWDAFGGDNSFYDGWSTENNGLTDLIVSFWGDLGCIVNGCTEPGWSHAITADSVDSTHQWAALVFDNPNIPRSYSEDYITLRQLEFETDNTHAEVGSALVRQTAPTTVVPLPGALWLFGSGILVLFGVTKQRTRT